MFSKTLSTLLNYLSSPSLFKGGVCILNFPFGTAFIKSYIRSILFLYLIQYYFIFWWLTSHLLPTMLMRLSTEFLDSLIIFLTFNICLSLFKTIYFSSLNYIFMAYIHFLISFLYVCLLLEFIQAFVSSLLSVDIFTYYSSNFCIWDFCLIPSHWRKLMCRGHIAWICHVSCVFVFRHKHL